MRLTNVFTSLYQAAIVHRIAPGRPALPFVIAAGPRSGSTLLQRLLHSHLNAVCMHELLVKSGGTPRFYRYNLGRRDQLIHLRERSMERFLEKILLAPQPPWINAVGFKAIWLQPREKEERRETWHALGEIPDLHVIWLRRNPVRRMISFAIARKTGEWVGKKTEKPLSLDPSYILRKLEIDAQEAEAARKRIEKCEIMEVKFNSLTENPNTVLSDVQNFLGLTTRSLHSALTPQNPKAIQDMAANFEEIKEELMGTEWEDALEDALGRRPKTV